MNKVALLILDGWGHGDKSKSDGIFNARTPYMDHLELTAPHAELLTDGEHVGLPNGQMGNSEVGHLNIGAGRIVYQELTRINKAIKDGAFQKNTQLLRAFNKAKATQKKITLYWFSFRWWCSLFASTFTCYVQASCRHAD